MIWMIEKLRTRLFLKEFQYDLHVPIQIEVEYQLEGDKVFSSFLSSKIRYNRPHLIKEAKSQSLAELDHRSITRSSGSLRITFHPRDTSLKEKAWNSMADRTQIVSYEMVDKGFWARIRFWAKEVWERASLPNSIPTLHLMVWQTMDAFQSFSQRERKALGVV